ncbi:uncharacterized protein ACWYII_015686 isoform 2-T2 [Salvelinus alpinus]
MDTNINHGKTLLGPCPLDLGGLLVWMMMENMQQIRQWWSLVLLQNFPMPSEEERLKDRKRWRKQNTLQDEVEDDPPKSSQHVTSASSSAGADDTENKMHGELGAVNWEADVLLRDTLEAARWCERQRFKGTVSLPSVIGMAWKTHYNP